MLSSVLASDKATGQASVNNGLQSALVSKSTYSSAEIEKSFGVITGSDGAIVFALASMFETKFREDGEKTRKDFLDTMVAAGYRGETTSLRVAVKQVMDRLKQLEVTGTR